MPIRGFDFFRSVNSVFRQCPLNLLQNDRLIVDGFWFIKKYLSDTPILDLVYGSTCCRSPSPITTTDGTHAVSDCMCARAATHVLEHILVHFIETLIIPHNVDLLWIWSGVMPHTVPIPSHTHKFDIVDNYLDKLFVSSKSNDTLFANQCLKKIVSPEWVVEIVNSVLQRYVRKSEMVGCDGVLRTGCVNVIRAPCLAMAQAYEISQVLSCYVFTSNDYLLFENTNKLVSDIVFFNQLSLNSGLKYSLPKDSGINIVVRNGRIDIRSKCKGSCVDEGKSVNGLEIEKPYIEIVHRPQILKYLKMSFHKFQTLCLILGTEFCPTILHLRMPFNIEKIIADVRTISYSYTDVFQDPRYRREVFGNNGDLYGLFASTSINSMSLLQGILSKKDPNWLLQLVYAKTVLKSCPVMRKQKVVYLSEFDINVHGHSQKSGVSDDFVCDKKDREYVFGNINQGDAWKRLWGCEYGADVLRNMVMGKENTGLNTCIEKILKDEITSGKINEGNNGKINEENNGKINEGKILEDKYNQKNITTDINKEKKISTDKYNEGRITGDKINEENGKVKINEGKILEDKYNQKNITTDINKEKKIIANEYKEKEISTNKYKEGKIIGDKYKEKEIATDKYKEGKINEGFIPKNTSKKEITPQQEDKNKSSNCVDDLENLQTSIEEKIKTITSTKFVTTKKISFQTQFVMSSIIKSNKNRTPKDLIKYFMILISNEKEMSRNKNNCMEETDILKILEKENIVFLREIRDINLKLVYLWRMVTNNMLRSDKIMREESFDFLMDKCKAKNICLVEYLKIHNQAEFVNCINKIEKDQNIEFLKNMHEWMKINSGFGKEYVHEIENLLGKMKEI